MQIPNTVFKMKRLWILGGLIVTLCLLSACKKDPIDKPDPDPDPQDSTIVLKINSFVFADFTPAVEAVINHQEKTITASIPLSGDIKKLKPTIEITEGATISPPSGFQYDFTNPLVFTLKKDTVTVKYTATVQYAQSDANTLTKVSFPDLFRTGTMSGNSISLSVPFGTNLSEVLIQLEISNLATSIPASGTKVDLSQPLTITVISQSGLENSYTLTTQVMEQDVAIRAFWIPATWHSTFLTSYDKIQEGVNLAKELNFNTLYVCAWAQTRTLYPSQVLANNSSYNTPQEGMFSTYTGGSGDPLTDLISLAHAQGMKVILWYEYGFMAKWGAAPTPQNDKILAVHPHWVGINNQGTQSNYNNTDFYYNAYNPEVQQFMLDLIMEAVNNYNIDGVQGDDRLPAMPVNSGYDTYTVNRYKDEHGGQAPPQSFTNWAWMRWRADILNAFALDLYNTVKAAKPHVLVTSSPNPYPWAFNNLMQEWPVWLADGSVEVLSVQCYRYTISGYRSTINEVLSYFNNNGDGNLKRLVPGLILYSSQGLTDPALIAEKILYNRSVGISGEAFFYDTPLADERIKKVIRAFYPAPAIFPEF